MRESLSSIPLFQIVIVFVFLFTGYISLSINYSKAYNVKNEIVSIIKNQGGVCTSTTPGNNCYNFAVQIKDYFSDAAYHSSGTCKANWIGYRRNGEYIGESASDAAFCVHGVNLYPNSELPNAVYYQVEVFYQLDIPIISFLSKFSIKGETARVYAPNECKVDPSKYGQWCK